MLFGHFDQKQKGFNFCSVYLCEHFLVLFPLQNLSKGSPAIMPEQGTFLSSQSKHRADLKLTHVKTTRILKLESATNVMVNVYGSATVLISIRWLESFTSQLIKKHRFA